MTYKLSKRSKDRLEGVHPDLVEVITESIKRVPIDFGISEGMRTVERQKTLLDSGASTTMNSRHLTGHAIDFFAVVGGEVRWDWPLYHQIADVIIEVAKELDVAIDAGAKWTRFPDGPHVQLAWKEYPKGGA